MEAPPFADFLHELHRRGVPVSLSQHQDVARLCVRLGGWSGCDAAKMAKAIASLLGRSGPEVQEIEQAFFQHYAKAYLFQDNAVPLPAGVKRAALSDSIERAQRLPRQRWLRWGLMALGVVLGLLVALQVQGLLPLHRAKMPEAGPELDLQEPLSLPGARPAKRRPATREPKLPPPVSQVHRVQQLVWTMPWLLLLIAVYGWRRHKELRGWARRYWKEVRGALTGPTDFELKLLDLRDPFPRQDLDDVATILGRGAEQYGGKKLDVERSIKATTEHAALPTLVFDRKASGRSLVVLWDISVEMRLWERKVKALVNGLMRRGVRMEVYYFDGSAARISQTRHGKPLSLAQLQRQNPDAALLILSTGSLLLDDQEEKRRAGKLAPWLEQIRRFRLRAWLHPVSDAERWRPVLAKPWFWQRYMRVIPMTRSGLLAAAYELAQEADRRVHIPQEATRPARQVQPADVRKMQRLMALYPGAPLELVELMRQRFCPQVPDEVVLDLLTVSQAHTWRTLRMGEPEVGRLLRELQEEEAKLPPEQREEEQVRRYLLKVLSDSEPADRASLAHLKSRLRRAMQQMYLHDLGHRNIDEAVATLKELMRGPLWDEAHGELWPVCVPGQPGPHGAATRPIAAPVAARLAREVMTLVKQTAGGKVATPQATDGKGNKPPRWLRMPRPGELAPAMLLASALAAVVAIRGIGKERIEHIKGYRVTATLPGDESDQVELRVEAQTEGLPEVVEMCLEDDCEQTSEKLMLKQGAWTGTRGRPREDMYAHVQARLPKGNLVYSEAVLIPGYRHRYRPSSATAEKSPLIELGGASFLMGSTQMEILAAQEWCKRQMGPIGARECPLETFNREYPQHRVYVSPFAIEKTEVSNRQLAAWLNEQKDLQTKTERMDNTGEIRWVVKGKERWVDLFPTLGMVRGLSYRDGRYQAEPGTENMPAVQLSWYAASAYCQSMGRRLPTEAEWEYAARTDKQHTFPWGAATPSCEGVVIARDPGDNCVRVGENLRPVDVATQDRTKEGVLNLGGNVAEWVADAFEPSYRACPAPCKDPVVNDYGEGIAATKKLRVFRGGSWSLPLAMARSATRSRATASTTSQTVGFRCAVSLSR